MLRSSITALELEQTFAPSIVEAELFLVQKCKEVAEVAKRSGDVKKKLDELATIANKLPG